MERLSIVDFRLGNFYFLVNRNVNKMLDFCPINSSIIGSIFYHQKLENKYIFVAERREAHSIIVLSQDLKQRPESIQTVKQANIGTTYRLVKAELRVD